MAYYDGEEMDFDEDWDKKLTDQEEDEMFGGSSDEAEDDE